MVKKVIATVIGSVLIGIIALSFLEVYQEPEALDKKIFTYSLGSVNNNLKDITKISMREKDIIAATCKGLVDKNSQGKIENSLAKEVKIKEDGIEYEFVLKDDIKWSDEKNITSADIINFFKELIVDQEEENIKALMNIYGAREFRDSDGSDNSKLAMIEGDNSVIIRLNKKDTKFIEEMSKPIYKIRKNINMWEDIKANHKSLVYSGEYSIESITNEYIKLKTNDLMKTEIPKEIKIIKNVNEEVSMAQFETGDIDIVVDPPSKQLNRLEKEERLKSFSSTKGKYIYINSDKKEVVHENRKAIYKLFVSAIGDYHLENANNIEEAEYSYFIEDKKNLNNVQSRKVDTTKTKGKAPKIITVLALDTQENRSLCDFIQAWFKDNTESVIRYTLVNDEEYKNISLRDRYNITLIDLELNSNERKSTFEALSYWYNKTEKDTYEKLNGTNKSEFRELENMLFSSYRIMPLFFENKNVAISKNIEDISFDYHGNINFSSIKLKK